MHSSAGYEPPRIVPATREPRAGGGDPQPGRARRDPGRRQGALGAGEELLEAADLLGAGIAKALLGRAVVPDDLPFVTGSIGLLGTRPSWDMMTRCDTLLMVGSSFPYSEFLPEEGQARGVQIDLDARRIGIRYPMEVQLVGDARETLRALLPLLERKNERDWQDEIVKSVEEWWAPDGAPRLRRRRPDQPAAGLLGALEPAARRLHPQLRLRLGRQLVRA